MHISEQGTVAFAGSWPETIIRYMGWARIALDLEVLAGLRERYDAAVSFGISHNRFRDWDSSNHPGYALGTWLREYKELVLLFIRDFAVPWTSNVSVRREGGQAAPGSLGLLAHPAHRHPMAPDSQLD